MAFHLAKYHQVYARVLQRETHTARVRHHMGEAAARFTRCSAPGYATAAAEELADIG